MEIVDFVINHAARLTPADAEAFRPHLAEVRLEVTQVRDPAIPHLANQVEFLAELFEDVADRNYQALPYSVFAEVLFALQYLLEPTDLIPDALPNGFQDDSSVVRGVLLRHEQVFRDYAEARGHDWSKVTGRA